MDNNSIIFDKLKKINFFTSNVKKYDANSDNSNEVIKLANIASGEMGIRGTIDNIQHFLNDIKGFDGLTFELEGIDEVNFSQEHIDAEGKVRIYLPVKYRWSINVDEAKTISKKYDLNIWIEVFETYLGFREEVCIIGGNVVYSDFVEWNYYQGEW